MMQRESTLRGHSKDNPMCTCKHDAGRWKNEYEANPECPVSVDSLVLSVAFSPGGHQIVAGCVDGCIYLWRRAEDGGKKNGRFNLSAS